jgi:hypothetical protein
MWRWLVIPTPLQFGNSHGRLYPDDLWNPHLKYDHGQARLGPDPESAITRHCRGWDGVTDTAFKIGARKAKNSLRQANPSRLFRSAYVLNSSETAELPPKLGDREELEHVKYQNHAIVILAFSRHAGFCIGEGGSKEGQQQSATSAETRSGG